MDPTAPGRDRIRPARHRPPSLGTVGRQVHRQRRPGADLPGPWRELIVGKGYASITGIVGFLKRAEHCGRPVRVLYISDHDRNGRSMPPAAARQIEFWREELDLDADVALTPLGIDPRADRRIRTAEGAGH